MTTKIRSIGVAVESTFASVDSATGIPSASGLTFFPMEADTDGIAPFGEFESNERMDARSSDYDLPPEPVTIWASGTRVRRRKGSITLTLPLRTAGSGVNYATNDVTPLGLLWGSGMAYDEPGAAADAVATAGTTTSHTVTTVGNVAVGIGLAAVINGRREFSAVTNKSGSVITNSPAWSTALSLAQSARLCSTFSPCVPELPGASVALELRGFGWKTYAYGCRLESWTTTLKGRATFVSLTLRCSFVQDDNDSGNNAIEPVRANGAIAHSLGSYTVISSTAIGSSPPAALGRTALGIDEFSVNFTNTLAEVGHSSDAVGHSNLQVTGSKATGSLLLSVPVAGLDDLFLNQEQRSILVGLGPQVNGSGAAFYWPAATFQGGDPSGRDLGGETVRQRLSFGAGLWDLDQAAQARPANTRFRLFLAR